MSDPTLEQRLKDLEERVKKLEEMIAPALEERKLMEQYYGMAKRAVIREQKASVIFLQRKLLIDVERAKKLLDQLQQNGVIGPDQGFKPRKILQQSC